MLEYLLHHVQIAAQVLLRFELLVGGQLLINARKGCFSVFVFGHDKRAFPLRAISGSGN